MKYFLFILLISFCYSSALGQEDIEDFNLEEEVREIVLHQDYHLLKKYYSNQEWDQRTTGYGFKSLCIIVNALDTMSYPLDNKDNLLYIRAATPNIYERVEENGKIKRNLVRQFKITPWIEMSCFGGPYNYSRLDSVRVRKIQSKLKKEKWYKGPVDGTLNMPTYFALKFYNSVVLKHRDAEIMHPPIYTSTSSLVAFGIIDDPKDYAKRVQIVLKRHGYDVGEIDNGLYSNEKTMEALQQFKKDNDLKINRLNSEIVNQIESIK